MMKPMEWIERHLWEIEDSRSLRFFGGLLALTHCLTFLHWYFVGPLPMQLYAGDPLCWPVFENCTALRIVPLGVFSFLFYFYFVIGLVTALFFFATRATALSWSLLLLLFFLKIFFYVQDLRLSSNVHYLLFGAQFIYLFIPNKQMSLKAFIVSYFIASGLFKMSPSWLTGDWFMHHNVKRVKLAEWFAALTILVEMIGTAALLFGRGRYFLLSLVAMVTYNSVLWWLDGFFTPAVNLAVIAFFVLVYFDEQRTNSNYLHRSFLRPQPSRLGLFVILILFWGAQLLPAIKWKDVRTRQTMSALAVNRVAANDQCHLVVFARFKDRTEQINADEGSTRTTEQKCDAYLRFLDLKHNCDEFGKKPGFETLAAYFEVKGLRDGGFRRVFEINDFCRTDVQYKDYGI
jgi:hypothetical protein